MTTYPQFNFEVSYKSPISAARLGKITTPHGIVETPAFIFCATKAAIKGITPKQLKDAQTQIILSNTYHLMLQPGSHLIEECGKLQKFTGWKGPMLTDSGGFQIFSLGHGYVAEEIKGKNTSHRPKTLLKITEEGAEFRSYLDGKKHLLTPEKSIQVQRRSNVNKCSNASHPTIYRFLSTRKAGQLRVRFLRVLDALEVCFDMRLFASAVCVIQSNPLSCTLRDVKSKLQMSLPCPR